MKPNFLNIHSSIQAPNLEMGSSKPFVTAEGIKVKPTFTKMDIQEAEHLGFGAGIPPFLRGPYSTM